MDISFIRDLGYWGHVCIPKRVLSLRNLIGGDLHLKCKLLFSDTNWNHLGILLKR